MPAFELDLFGRLQNLSASALESYLASEEAARAAFLVLISQVAQGFFNKLSALEQLRLAQHTWESRLKSYAFIESRVRSGQSSLLDLEQARSLVEAAAVMTAEREREFLWADNALRLLSGGFEPQSLPAAIPLLQQKLGDLPQGVVSAALLQRPDIREAEHRLRAANADIGAARAAFFPSISLTGELGYMSDDLSALFSGGVWSFMPKISLPIFSGWRLSANLELAEARQQSAIVQYEKVIQSAFREAADALLARGHFARQLAAQTRYLNSQKLALELALNRYANGAASYLEALDAQREVFTAQQNLLDIRREQLSNEVGLYIALGGGLETAAAPERLSPEAAGAAPVGTTEE
jgi:Cu(I)/Ag(I) efflux system outer membrane protein